MAWFYLVIVLLRGCRTGKRIWHFQMVHLDLWDFDATAHTNYKLKQV